MKPSETGIGVQHASDLICTEPSPAVMHPPQKDSHSDNVSASEVDSAASVAPAPRKLTESVSFNQPGSDNAEHQNYHGSHHDEVHLSGCQIRDEIDSCGGQQTSEGGAQKMHSQPTDIGTGDRIVGSTGTSQLQNPPPSGPPQGNVSIQTEVDALRTVSRSGSGPAGAVAVVRAIGGRIIGSTDRARSELLTFVSTLARAPRPALPSKEHNGDGLLEGLGSRDGHGTEETLELGSVQRGAFTADDEIRYRVALELSVVQDSERPVAVTLMLAAAAGADKRTLGNAATVAVEALSSSLSAAAAAAAAAAGAASHNAPSRDTPCAESDALGGAKATNTDAIPMGGAGAVASAASHIGQLVGGIFGRDRGSAPATPPTDAPLPQLPTPTAPAPPGVSVGEESVAETPPESVPPSDLLSEPPSPKGINPEAPSVGEGTVGGLLAAVPVKSELLTADERRKLRVATQMAAQLRQASSDAQHHIHLCEHDSYDFLTERHLNSFPVLVYALWQFRCGARLFGIPGVGCINWD